jgi:tetratricopeptide (TPR) repeat protein
VNRFFVSLGGPASLNPLFEKAGKMKHFWIIAVVLHSLCLPGFGHARPMFFTESYAYDAGESDSKLTCRAISLLQVKRLLLEKIGTYLKSETEIVNSRLNKDMITALTAGIVRTEILKEEWDGRNYRLTARIEADPEAVDKAIDEVRNNPEEKDKIYKIEDINQQSLERIKALKTEMATLQQNLIDLNQDYSRSAHLLDAWNAFEEGVQLMTEKKFKDAASAFTHAIENKPTYINYFNRAKAYMRLEQFEAAIADLNHTLELNPNMANAYLLKGMALMKMGRKREGKQEIQKAADLGNGQAKQWLRRSWP